MRGTFIFFKFFLLFRNRIYLGNNENVEELQNRLRLNIETIQILNQQVINFNFNRPQLEIHLKLKINKFLPFRFI